MMTLSKFKSPEIWNSLLQLNSLLSFELALLPEVFPIELMTVLANHPSIKSVSIASIRGGFSPESATAIGLLTNLTTLKIDARPPTQEQANLIKDRYSRLINLDKDTSFLKLTEPPEEEDENPESIVIITW